MNQRVRVFTQYRVPRPPSLRWVHGESFSMRTTTSGEHLACTHTMPSTTTMLPSLESSIVYNIPKPSLGVNAVSIHNPTQPNPIQQISRNISLLLSQEDSISLTQSWNLGIYLRYRQDWTFTTTTLHRMFRSKVSLLDLSLSHSLKLSNSFPRADVVAPSICSTNSSCRGTSETNRCMYSTATDILVRVDSRLG